tara:strand:- start:178 stop:447 length:270 start_codon:yes stop_codon:yes gene_type:complete
MTGAMAGAGAPPDLSLLTLPTAVYALTNFEYNRLKKIKGDKSSRAWLDAVDAILSARAALQLTRYPSDWWEQMDRMREEFFDSDEFKNH